MAAEIRTVGNSTSERLRRNLRCFSGHGTLLNNCYLHIAGHLDFSPNEVFDITLVAHFRGSPEVEGIVPVRAFGSSEQPGVRFLEIKLPHSDEPEISEHLFSPGDRYTLEPDTDREDEALPVLVFTELEPVDFTPPPHKTSLPLKSPEEDAKIAEQNKARDARAARKRELEDRSAQQLLDMTKNKNPEETNDMAQLSQSFNNLLRAASYDTNENLAASALVGMPARIQDASENCMEEEIAPQGPYDRSGENSLSGSGRSATSRPSNPRPSSVPTTQHLGAEDDIEGGISKGAHDAPPPVANLPNQVNVGASGSGSAKPPISAEWLNNALEGFRRLAEDNLMVPILKEENRKLRLENEQLQRNAAKEKAHAADNQDLVRYLMKQVEQRNATNLALKEHMATLNAQLRTQTSRSTSAAERLHTLADQVNDAARQLYTHANDSITKADAADAFLQKLDTDNADSDEDNKDDKMKHK